MTNLKPTQFYVTTVKKSFCKVVDRSTFNTIAAAGMGLKESITETAETINAITNKLCEDGLNVIDILQRDCIAEDSLDIKNFSISDIVGVSAVPLVIDSKPVKDIDFVSIDLKSGEVFNYHAPRSTFIMFSYFYLDGVPSQFFKELLEGFSAKELDEITLDLRLSFAGVFVE